jgi:hypothetical protein
LDGGSGKEQESSSSSEDEDDEAELVNPKFETKFLQTLAMIRDNDPKLKDLKEELFKDADFEQDENESENGDGNKK